jgi:hypothetical protein
MRFTRILLLVCLAALIVPAAAFALRFTDDSYNPPTGETGKPYSFAFHGAGGCGPALPYQYRIIDGSLPTGLTLHSDGRVDGTPTSAGTWTFWIELSDQNPPSVSWCRPSTAQRQFSIRIIQGLTINQRQSTLTPGMRNQPYSLQFSANGGGTLTWSVSNGSLPEGLTLNASTGTLSGTPTTTGDFHFQVKVSDGTRSDVQTYSMSVVEALKIAGTPPAGEIGRPYQAALAATGGRGPYSWSAAGLPAGLTLDPATGAITGSPTAAGVAAAQVTVLDALGLKTTLNVSMRIAAHLGLVGRRLAAGKAGVAYHGRIPTIGGVAPRVFRILSGALPAGLRLNTHTGSLRGRPQKAGTFRLRVRVRDALGVVAVKAFVLKVS